MEKRIKRAEIRETDLGMLGATDPRRGEAQLAADRIGTEREGHYLRDKIGPVG